jgi:hypothetical protein
LIDLFPDQQQLAEEVRSIQLAEVARDHRHHNIEEY